MFAHAYPQPANDLETMIPKQNVQPGTEPPYETGDRCQVLITAPSATGRHKPEWATAVVLSCEQPRGARRFVLAVAVAESIHHVYLNHRVYCNEDGRGEEVRPLVDAWMAAEDDEALFAMAAAVRVTAATEDEQLVDICSEQLVNPKTDEVIATCTRPAGHEHADDAYTNKDFHKEHGGPGWIVRGGNTS